MCRNPWHFNDIIFWQKKKRKKEERQGKKKRNNPSQTSSSTSLIREAVDSPDLESSRSAEPLVWADLGLSEGPLTGASLLSPYIHIYIYIIYIYTVYKIINGYLPIYQVTVVTVAKRPFPLFICFGLRR